MATEVKDPATGEIKRVVDFDALREQLGDVAEGARERYRFTWPGKREAKEEARRPIAKTMRPVKERSKNWDSTHNLYIEGDNLDALKILRETYAGRIKMIYIDPPYNTGHDFIYQDKFRKDADDYAGESGDYDEEGGRLVANPESNGRFHSDWCSMMYPRLLLARDLLDNDGVIFISISDVESASLRVICDSIFGNKNYVGQIIWESTTQPDNIGGARFKFQQKAEYILFYARNKANLAPFILKKKDNVKKYPHKGKYGPCRFEIVERAFDGAYARPTMRFRILGQEPRPGKQWQIGERTARELERAGKVELVDGIVKRAVYPEDEASNDSYYPFWSIFSAADNGTSQKGKMELEKLVGKVGFDTVKPVELLKRIMGYFYNDLIVLDFFSGSATTAEAVMQLNADDGGSRSFILAQLPVSFAEDGNAAKAGYHTICEIGEERIRRAGEKIKAEVEKANEQLELGAEPKQVPDIGFRVLRIDSSNYRDVRRSPNDLSQGMLDSMVDVSEAGRSPLDKLFECFPTFQLPYDSSIEVLDDPAFTNHTVYSVNGGQLVACFDADIPESVLRGMAALEPKPSYAVVAEAGLNNSQTVTNFAEIFKQAANAEQGATQVRVI